jgi:hypothetical protein
MLSDLAPALKIRACHLRQMRLYLLLYHLQAHRLWQSAHTSNEPLYLPLRALSLQHHKEVVIGPEEEEVEVGVAEVEVEENHLQQRRLMALQEILLRTLEAMGEGAVVKDKDVGGIGGLFSLIHHPPHLSEYV